jgi:protein-tyrosine phosphatase
MPEKKRILFVCLGNIVRSPLGEHMFNHLAKEAGVEDKYEVVSAGTSAYHFGESPDPRMRKVAASNGLVYDGRARQVTPYDLDAFDVIIAMDMDNKYNLLSLANSPEQEAKIVTMRTFDPEGSPTDSVPDPYYGGIDGFEITYEIVARSCKGLLEALETGGV